MTHPTPIVELVGLPGSGKTTLAHILCQQAPQIFIAPTPYLKEIKYSPFLLKNALLLLPTLLYILPGRKHCRFTPRDVALMTILTGWHHTLERQSQNGRPLIILDEGPICYLTRLYAFGSELLKGKHASHWWAMTFKKWSRTLDAVVLLDADDPLLIQRIRARDMWQEVKAMSDDEALQYIAHVRSAQRYVMERITAQPGSPCVFNISSGCLSPEQIADVVMGLLNL